MLNTCSIGRRWKPREGWSRPVLTGERGTLSNPFLCGGLGLVLWWFLSLDGKEHCFLWSRNDTGEAFLLASVVRFPDRHDRNRGWFRCRPPVLPVGRCIGFAVVMAQVRRPVPFRTRKLRPGRGDGTALERVWESSTPPHSTSGFPSSVTLREPLFFLFVFWFVFPATRGRLPIHNIQLNNMKILGRALRSQGSFCISGQIIAIPANCPA